MVIIFFFDKKSAVGGVEYNSYESISWKTTQTKPLIRKFEKNEKQTLFLKTIFGVLIELIRNY